MRIYAYVYKSVVQLFTCSVAGSEQVNILNNFLLFIKSKILRERIERGRVYTHMYIGAVFSCTGCSPGSERVNI